MQSDDNAVTIIGLGSMGAALAQAFLRAGHRTTVWNRTPQRAEPLLRAGAAYEPDVKNAVTASRLVIACLTNFEVTHQALIPAAEALAGRTLVTLNSGTPAGARQIAAWCAEQGANYLGGAVKNTPAAIGRPDTLLYYCGDRTVFEQHRSTLQILGGDTQYLGRDVDLAALYELAVGGTLLPALLGFFQGVVLITSRGLSAQSMVPHTVKWLEMISNELPRLAEEIDTGDYENPRSSLALFYEGIEHDEAIGREGKIDVSWNVPIHDLLRRAVAEGRQNQSISALTELLRLR
jgi:3-hydroxyisobutyrate dehydrogenase-like beta-hydroxyacid dehydrogenase